MERKGEEKNVQKNHGYTNGFELVLHRIDSAKVTGVDQSNTARLLLSNNGPHSVNSTEWL